MNRIVLLLLCVALAEHVLADDPGANASDMKIHFTVATTRPVAGQVRVEARLERYGPLPATQPFKDPLNISTGEIKRLQQDDCYQKLRSSERPKSMSLAVSSGLLSTVMRPDPGVYSLYATASDVQPDHCGEPMMGRALRVIAIESTASSTAPIEFKIPAGSYLQIGDAAPDISMKTLDGKPFQLSALRGHWVVVQFWATWCPPCVEELPTLQKIHRQFPKIEMVGVSFDEDAADAKHLIAEKGYDWTQLYLGAMETPLTRQWGIEVVPALYLIDPKGKIAGSAVTPDELIKLLPKE